MPQITQLTEKENTDGKGEDELLSEKNTNDNQEFFEDDLYVWNLLLVIDKKMADAGVSGQERRFN